MHTDSLRSALRAGTSAIHRQLDLANGEFDSVATYAAFVRKTYRFRLAVEQALADDQDWTVDAIAPLIALDLADLDVKVPAAMSFPAPVWTPWSRLGAHYVLEGSSLGARLLVRRAQALGMTAEHGARHLEQQAGDQGRWRAFIDQLDAVPEAHHPEVLAAAITTFRFALTVYAESAHEPA